MKQVDLSEFLDALTESVLNNEETIKVEVGAITQDLLQDFIKMKYENQDLMDEIELRKKQLKMQADRTIKREYDFKINEAMEKHQNAWRKIYKELDLEDRGNDGSYEVDPRTGTVTVEIPR